MYNCISLEIYATTGVSMYVCISLNICISLEELFLLKRKKGFPFISLRRENNLIDAKQKTGSEKKRKKRKKISSEQAKHMRYGSNFALFRF
jgi:hypothetical protein